MIEIKSRLDGNRWLFNQFSSIDELTKWLDDEKNQKHGRDNSSHSKDSDFTGTSSYNQAVELLKYGDKETYDYIKEKQRKIKIDELVGNAMNKAKIYNDVVGYQPCVPLFLNNVPTNMINMKKKNLNTKIINIYLDICCSAWVSSNTLRDAGTMYATALDIIEKSGYRVNLYIGDASKYDDEVTLWCLKVKTDREPLNLEKMAFTIANPSILRRIGFKYQETCNSEQDFTHHGYGQPYDNEKKMEEIFKKNLDIDMMVFTYQHLDDDSDKLLQSIIERLKKKGITIGDE